MSAPGYEELEHTADLALRVWGNDYFSLLDHSAKGMYYLMGITSNGLFPVDWTFKIENGSQECILVDFLSELLFLCEENQIIFKEFKYFECGKYLEITAAGHKYDHKDRSIKAVTFHNLDVIETDFGLETTITFDV